jgi:hypothetical protein
MPNINFPSGPTTSQSYTFNGSTWIYNGKAWILNGTSGPQGNQGPQGDQGPQGPSFIIPAIDTWVVSYGQNVNNYTPTIVEFNTLDPTNTNDELLNTYGLQNQLNGTFISNGGYVLYLQVSGYIVWSSYYGPINQVVRGVKNGSNVLVMSSSKVENNNYNYANYSLVPFSFNVILGAGEYFWIDAYTENNGTIINYDQYYGQNIDSKLTIQLVNYTLK